MPTESVHKDDHSIKERKPLKRSSTARAFTRIVTQCESMRAVFRYTEAVARSPEPVLIVGETGVGKELLAEAVHFISGRSEPLVSVNVAALDSTTFSDTLFGHKRGAFTGAEKDRNGLVEKAAQGTLFLDEIGSMHLDMQTKLLRLIQEREFLPLGADTVKRSYCRIVAATNDDLLQSVQSHAFRADLYHRLRTHMIRIPPLRERYEDLPLLVDQFLNEASGSLGKPKPTVPKELFAHLGCYAFPGNIRELRAMVFDAVAGHQNGVISIDAFLRRADHATDSHCLAVANGKGMTFSSVLPTLKEATHQLFREALDRTKGNQRAAAQLLSVSRRTINRYNRK